MVDPAEFYEGARAAGIGFFVGVPDSLLKNFCAYVADHGGGGEDLITANEGAAVGYAAGRYLGSGEVGMVYLQNSGLGNAVNPLVSLADPEVYGVPMVLLVGWRGEPGRPDEPQHVKQGAINNALLETLGVPYQILPETTGHAIACVREVSMLARSEERPHALVVRKGTFAGYALQNKPAPIYEMRREEALEAILAGADPGDVIVSTTGKTSREVFEIRGRRGEGHERDFLTVGCMGHASSIAHGLADAQPGRRVIVIDGDGAAIMHLGTLAVIASEAPANIRHIVINNGAHESVGGQPTAGFAMDLCGVAMACGYREALRADTRAELDPALRWLAGAGGPALLEIRVRVGAREDLGRPTIAPADNKRAFMANLSDS